MVSPWPQTEYITVSVDFIEECRVIIEDRAEENFVKIYTAQKAKKECIANIVVNGNIVKLYGKEIKDAPEVTENFTYSIEKAGKIKWRR